MNEFSFRNIFNMLFSLTWSVSGIFIKKHPIIFRRLSLISMPYFILDLYELEYIYVFHHFLAFILCSVLAFSKNARNYYNFYIYILQLEYSTFILNLYYLTKHSIIKYIFAISFLYFRTYKFTLWLLLDNTKSDELNLICLDHNLYSKTSCLSLVNLGTFSIGFLNLTWGYLIIQKLFKELRMMKQFYFQDKYI